MENRKLMAMARESLSGKWGLAVGTFLVFGLIIAAAGSNGIAVLLIGGPMLIGLAIFSLTIARNQDAKLEQIFKGFKKNFGTALVAYLLKAIFVFLWTLLLIIPGIIAAISYSQVFYILAENDSISGTDALKKSKEMMYGYKWKYFCLRLRFIGWFLLCILTLGVGFLWFTPYITISCANFYDDIKGKKITE
ncbi:MAG: DUF975 family protein [Candidatus Marinimicrobia bacterium]|jgi:uncharacterized membrane protein|nr:DUF975 family protein [Candidatus Neomarinimicrobiota bacterium]